MHSKRFRSGVVRTWYAALVAALLPAVVVAATVKTDNVEAELISRTVALAPGETATLGLRLKHDPQWHTYWLNPGDSGMPTTIQWKLPAGFKAAPIQWPVPKRIPLAPMMNHGYDGEIVLPVQVTVPKDWPPGQEAKLAARADWLVCKDVCLPGGADLTLTLPVAAASAVADPKWATLFDKAFAGMPGGKAAAEASTGNGFITLKFAGAKPQPGKEVYVLPTIEGLVEHGAPQKVSAAADATVITLTVSSQLSANEPRIAGVVVGLAERALTFESPMAGKLVAGKAVDPATVTKPVGAGGDSLSFVMAVVFSLVGGLILNLMPCVFPILSLKVLGFAQGNAANKGAMRVNGMAFAAGVVVSFMALAALLMGLRSAGDAIGWGFQLQSPAVVTGLALLFFVLGLNLSGVFEFGNLLPQSLASATLKHPAADAFFSGVLAAVVASPCTAPFMGAAIGYALTESTLIALAIFGALGVGMALPYVLLCWFPAWLKHLPRPGPWLARFKQVLAFPMYATVVWLTWVLLLQLGADAIIWFGAGLVVIAFGAWLMGQSGGSIARGVALAAIAGGVFAAWPGAVTSETTRGGVQAKDRTWVAYSKAELSELGSAGKPVFVDFTAAWCVTCQVNKKVVLEAKAVKQAFATAGVTLMRGDWTRRDPAITAALAEFGRNGVPVYVLYAPGKAPVLLPEILSERIVLDALKTLGKSI